MLVLDFDERGYKSRHYPLDLLVVKHGNMYQ